MGFRIRKRCVLTLTGFLIYVGVYYVLAKFSGPGMVWVDGPIVITFSSSSLPGKEPNTDGSHNAQYSQSNRSEVFNKIYVTLLSRKFRIKSVCGSNMFKGTSSRTKEHMKHVIVNDRKRILFCSSSGSQDTFLRKVFTNQNARQRGGGHIQDVLEKVTYLNTLEPEESEKRLTDYKKIIVVQNPLERLVRMFNSYFHSSSDSQTFESYEKLIEFYRQYPHLSEEVRTKREYEEIPLSFREYLQYFIDRVNTRHGQEEQFMTLQELCGPCDMSYDFVLNTSASGDEVDVVRSKLNITEPLEKRVKTVADGLSNMDNDEIYSTYYRDMPDKVLQSLWKVLGLDAVMFGFIESKDLPSHYIG